MAERHTYEDSQNRRETVNPHNPPNSVEPVELKEVPQSAAGVAGMWYVLGPLLLILVVVGAGLFFWADDPDVDRDETPAVGTIGERELDHGPGGGSPDPRPDGARNEVEFRGGDATPGEAVTMNDAVVVNVEDARTFKIQKGAMSATVVAPENAPAVRAGTRVDVSGEWEAGGKIRAARVTARN